MRGSQSHVLITIRLLYGLCVPKDSLVHDVVVVMDFTVEGSMVVGSGILWRAALRQDNDRVKYSPG